MTDSDSSETALEAALKYAARGYSVFPIVPRDKNPLTEHGCHDATTDVETILEWWRRWPDANVGMACQGLFVVDVDPLDDGSANLWLDAEPGALLRRVDCPVAITPRGGCHFFFRAPDDVALKPGTSRIAPHVDHRTGPGSYVVCSPSIGENGAAYRWETPLSCSVDRLPLVPTEIIKRLTELDGPCQRTSRRPKNHTHTTSLLCEGQRNDGLTREAGRLRGAGCDAHVISAALQKINTDYCVPPLDFSEVERIAESVSRYPAGGNARRSNLPTQAVVHRLCDVQSEKVEWLWPDRIPLGKLTLLSGDPGLGKSFVTCEIAARVSRGAAWSDAPGKSQPVGSVVMLNCEDGLRDTIRPRLERAGADLGKIIAIEGVKVIDSETGLTSQRGFNLAVDIVRLADEVAKLAGCRLVVIDPVSAYLGDTDSHKNADVRALLAPLSDFAEKHSVAVVMVNHLAKSGGAKAIYRPMGSLGFVAAARAVWHVAKDPDDAQRRLILPAKMNLAPDPTGLAYRIEQGSVCWEADPVKMTADELLVREAATKPNARTTQREQAESWLSEMLKDGSVPSKQVLANGREHGFGEKLLRNALESIGGLPQKSSMDGPWLWTLPVQKRADDVDWSTVFPPGLPEGAPNFPKMPTI